MRTPRFRDRRKIRGVARELCREGERLLGEICSRNSAKEFLG